MATLKVPVSAEDHAQGPENADSDAGGIRRLRMPALRTRLSHRQGSPETFWQAREVGLSELPFERDASSRRSFRRDGGVCRSHGKFWEMHDLLFENQERLGNELFLELGERLALSTKALAEALENGTFEPRVRADFRGGVRSGVNGTPTFFINGHRHDDSFDYETLVSAINVAMDTAKSA